MHISSGSYGGTFPSNLGGSVALNPTLAPPTPGQSHQPFGDSATPAHSSAEMTEMLALIQKLNAKVDGLTTQLADRTEKVTVS
jgi:hypothetical protein